MSFINRDGQDRGNDLKNNYRNLTHLFIHVMKKDDLNVGDRCGPNKERECVLITDCLKANEKLKKEEFHNMERCGFQGKTEVVCCKSSKFKENGSTRPTSAIVACERYYPPDFNKGYKDTIGGENASLGDFPHIASLHVEGDEPGQIVWGNCAGSLISETFVVTAAHCVVRVDNKVPVMVRLGKIDLLGDADNTSPQNISVQEVIVHPDYNHAHGLNDIALLRLKKPAVLSFYVTPICLNTNTDIQDKLIVGGWGYINETTEETSRFLQKAYVFPYELDKCNETYFNSPRSRTILPMHLCARYLGRLPQNTCKGDSGGPMQIEKYGRKPFLVGITSFGRACAGPTPSVYTRVSEFVDWIEPIVWP
ncbi:hypothetical protein Trydic_g17529 [Trypoxylus dichotomus]